MNTDPEQKQNNNNQVEGKTLSIKPEYKLIDIKTIAKMIDFTPAYIYKMITEGKFPKSFKFGRSARWKLSDVLEWIDAHQSN